MTNEWSSTEPQARVVQTAAFVHAFFCRLYRRCLADQVALQILFSRFTVLGFQLQVQKTSSGSFVFARLFEVEALLHRMKCPCHTEPVDFGSF